MAFHPVRTAARESSADEIPAMPLTPDLRRGIDRIRDHLYGGGYPNPSQNAEQLSFLIFFYMFEAADAARVRAARRPKASAYASVFEGRWRLRNLRNGRGRNTKTVLASCFAGPRGRML